jgi:hypothetical protein
LLAVTNTLAYDTDVLIAPVKSFIVQAPEGIPLGYAVICAFNSIEWMVAQVLEDCTFFLIILD